MLDHKVSILVGNRAAFVGIEPVEPRRQNIGGSRNLQMLSGNECTDG